MELLTVPQAAEELGVSISTMYRLLNERKLPKVKVRNCTRVRPGDLARYIERSTENRVHGDAKYPRINYEPGMKVV